MFEQQSKRGHSRELPTIDTVDELTALVVGQDDTYVRISHGPDIDVMSGHSRDFEAEVDLPGLSVTAVAPEPWWPRPARDWVARSLCKYAELAEQGDDRIIWLLTGRVVGHGPDHEPLVADAEPRGGLRPHPGEVHLPPRVSGRP
ncbi:DUF6098 family protein [Nocardia sp. NPDC051321]|uniref:DUF6098 family protein n=1 Tax=Nocardia sp. NPDC051321 TaxID=3364323 RepID=UPI00378DA9A4